MHDGPALLPIGKEIIYVKETDVAKKMDLSSDLMRKEVAFAFSKHQGSNFTVTQGPEQLR